jgi:hypothetical protein
MADRVSDSAAHRHEEAVRAMDAAEDGGVEAEVAEGPVEGGVV